MKLTCTQDNFKKAIYNTERVVSKQTTLPILNNILIEAEKGGLKLSATNLEIGVVSKIGAKIESEGKIAIPARVLSSFIANLPEGGNIQLETTSPGLKIKSGSAKALIKGLPATDFPLIPKKTENFQINLQKNEIKEIIGKVLISVAINEARQELTGINVIFKEKEVFLASTDSFRLSENRLVLKDTSKNKELYQLLFTKKNSIIIPATTMLELNRIISTGEEGDLKIAVEESQIFFETNGTTIVSRLINGKYPEYKHIVPQQFKTRAVGDKNLILGAVKMANVFASGKTNEIVLKIAAEEGKMFIEAKSAEAGENITELKLDITGPSQEIILNSRYLLDGLNAITTAKVAILLNNASTPIVLKEINEGTGEVLEDYIYIVMPIKN